MIEFPDKKYDVILADPPWAYNERIQHNGKLTTGSADMHYPTMKPKELMELPVQNLSKDDCLLFLWTTGPQLDVSITVGQAWGFEYKTVAFVWDKQRPNPGYYTMSQCEYVLVLKKGRIPKPRGSRSVRQFLQEKRAVHSRKPNTIHERIDEMFPEQEKIELFARRRYQGWDCWGNEIC